MNQGGGTSVKMSSTAVKGQVKGLLKGLRYISQMFDEDEEQEIEIGFPTDVKHLAHIGCEDEKTNKPSWMTEFKETQQPSTGAKTSEGQDNGNNSDTNRVKGDTNSVKGEGKRNSIRRSRPRSSENQSSTNSSPPREERASTKTTRRHRQSRQSNEDEENSKPPTTKQSRRKAKSSSEEKDKETSSTRKTSRTRKSSKADSLTDIPFTDPGPSAQ
uniref:CRIB domain-containing protein n=1 Tax=Medicago truncatula TaxID=3880 RepID=B7FMB7_MEDTR|nr:unknown [Medicago truncatula]